MQVVNGTEFHTWEDGSFPPGGCIISDEWYFFDNVYNLDTLDAFLSQG